MDEVATALDSIRDRPCEDLTSVITVFQLRPTLLDPVLADSVRILTTEFLRSGNVVALHNIYVLSRVRGYKHVLQHFPVTLELAPKLINSLETAIEKPKKNTWSDGKNKPDAGNGASKESQPNPMIVDAFEEDQSNTPWDWRAQYVLLLWVSCLVLAPFDLALVDEDVHNRLSKICSPLLSASGIQRDAAALLMARLLTRSRGKEADLAMTQFYNQRLQIASTDALGRLGTMKVLAIIMDRVTEPPTCVRNILNDVMNAAENDDDSFLSQYTTSGMELWIKILGRSALRDSESYAEFAIMELLTMFEDKSTNVRTAAAKYLARIAQQIAKNLEDDAESQEAALSQIWESIVDPMLECVDLSVASPDYWAGALFAVAEFIRRLPSRFWLTSSGKGALHCFTFSILRNWGLHFVQEKLQGQSGANVRDTACYVCWSLFRYIPNLDSRIRDTLFDSLMALAILDAEVHVRRAAAAALQEGLGRQAQSFPQKHAFEIMENINFHSVNQISRCYIEILPAFWNIRWIPWFLLHACFHHNPENRRLAAKAAPLLHASPSPSPSGSSTSSSCSSSNSSLISTSFKSIHAESHYSGRHDTSTELINLLLAHEENSTADMHGKYLVLSSLYIAGNHHRSEELVGIVQVPSSSDSELIFEAMLSLAAVSAEKGTQLLKHIDLSDIDSKNRSKGKSQMDRVTPLISAAQLLVSQIGSQRVVDICAERINDSALFIACLATLSKKISISKSIITSCLAIQRPESRAWACRLVGPETAELLIPALNDYSIDNRGDVGSWIREAALRKISELPGSCNDAIEATIWRLASENNQTVRNTALKTLEALGVIPHLLKNINKVLLEEEQSNSEHPLSDFASASFYVLLENCPETRRKDLISGLVSSVGGARGSVETLSGSFKALARYIPRHEWVLDEILAINRKEASVRTAAMNSTRSNRANPGADATRFEIMRTLKRLVVGFVPTIQDNRRILALAFNTSLVRGVSELVLLDAIDIMQTMAALDRDRVRLRLLNMVRAHCNGRIRQRAADAVYELDLTFGKGSSVYLDKSDLEKSALITVDWTQPDFQLYTKYLN